MPDRVGQQLGNYRLVALLGQGGFAEVYLGQHVRLDLQAAIKVLHTYLTDQEAEHFQREAQTIAKLTHPAIVRVFDYDVQDGVPFLVMDYAPNGSLRRRYAGGSVPPLSDILSWVKQVADALQYAHDQKFIHRDVKPENMLLGRRQEVLLSDFGLAALVHSSASLSTQQAIGTLPYMAPEQIAGHPRPASDQYALGVVVYEWLCGSRPFEGSVSEVMVQQLTVPPPPLHEKVGSIPLGIEQVVLRALAKEHKDRFASVQDFAQAFEQACQLTSGHPAQLPSEHTVPDVAATSSYATVAVPTHQLATPTAVTPSAEQGVFESAVFPRLTPATNLAPSSGRAEDEKLAHEEEETGGAMERIRILIADDHPLFRDGLRVLLESVPDMQVIGEAATGDEAASKAHTLQPDLILMDIKMPGLNGLEATRRILQSNPHIRILILTMFEDDESVFAAVGAGARGYMLKGVVQEETLHAIRAVASGEAVFGPTIAKRLIQYFSSIRPAGTSRPAQFFPELTEREYEILALIAQRKSNADIAAQLVLSPKTVRNHVSNILSKLQVADRAEAMRAAWAAGLGQIPSERS